HRQPDPEPLKDTVSVRIESGPAGPARPETHVEIANFRCFTERKICVAIPKRLNEAADCGPQPDNEWAHFEADTWPTQLLKELRRRDLAELHCSDGAIRPNSSNWRINGSIIWSGRLSFAIP